MLRPMIKMKRARAEALRAVRLAGWRALFLVAAGCSAEAAVVGPDLGAGEGRVASVAVAPATDTLLALGDTLRLTVTVRDESGALMNGETVNWSSSDETVATVDAEGLVTAQENGVVIITAAAGTVTGDAELTVEQQVSAVTVTPGTGDLTAIDQELQFQAAATDANGNTIADVEFVWASSAANVARVDETGLVTARGPGEAIISATAADVAGEATLTVTQSGTTLAYRLQPTSIVAGEPMVPAVVLVLLDGEGNVVTSGTDAVTLTLQGNTGPVPLLGTTTVNAVEGVATFDDLTAQVASTDYALTASAAGFATAISNGFEVAAAAPAELVFDGQPSTATAGETLSPITVDVLDRFGNRARSANVTVDLVLEPGALVVATEDAVSGTARFDDVILEEAGAGLRLRAAATGLTDATSDPFVVAPGAPARLAFVEIPTVVEGTVPFGARVAVHDRFGNLVSDAQTVVSVRLENNPNGGTLNGTGNPVTATAAGGVATLSLRVDHPGFGYTLRATATGLLGAESALFAVRLTFAQIDGGERRMCGITGNKALYCWGTGEIGDGSDADARSLTPVLIREDVPWAEIRVGAVR